MITAVHGCARRNPAAIVRLRRQRVNMWQLWMWVAASLLGPPATRIVVNIPAYRLDVFAKDSIVRTMPIAPGMPAFRTPRGAFAITSVEWNPWWIPPDRPWAAKEKPARPGPTNPMGRVKINFRPLYFLHGTPADHTIGSAASHGCVRLHNADAIALARMVLAAGAPGLTVEDIDRLATDTTTTRTIALDVPLPIELRYDLVEIREARLYLYRDVYGLATRSRRAEVIAALASRGLDTSAVDAARVRAFTRSVAARGSSILVDSLFAHR